MIFCRGKITADCSVADFVIRLVSIQYLFITNVTKIFRCSDIKFRFQNIEMFDMLRREPILKDLQADK